MSVTMPTRRLSGRAPQPAHPARRTPRRLRAAQVLSVVLAVPMTTGSVVFTVISPDRHYAAWVTWTFAPIAFLAGLALLATASRLMRDTTRVRTQMLGVLAVVQLFSVTKIVLFHESAAVPFLVLACVVMALLRPREAGA